MAEPRLPIDYSSDLPESDPPPGVLFWVGFIGFFALGVTIALVAAFAVVRRGGSVVGGIALGAALGGSGAWLVFFVAGQLETNSKYQEENPKRAVARSAVLSFVLWI